MYQWKMTTRKNPPVRRRFLPPSPPFTRRSNSTTWSSLPLRKSHRRTNSDNIPNASRTLERWISGGGDSDVLNSDDSKNNKDMESGRGSGTKANGSDIEGESSSVNESGNNKRRASGGNIVPMMSRHYRSVSVDSCFNFMHKFSSSSIGDDSLLVKPPSPCWGSLLRKVSPTNSVHGNSGFSIEVKDGEFTAAEMKKITANDKLAEMAISDPNRVTRRDLEFDRGFGMSSEIREPKKQRWDHDLASLPEHVIIDILARVPIGKYPKLCMVSKQFRSIVSSDELYARRISLGCTEACIYAVMHGAKTYDYVWYVLQRKANGRNHRFVPIQSIPPMLPQRESFVSVGSKIYMLGPTDYHEMTRSGLTVNFRSQVVKPPAGLPTSFMYGYAADVMDEKIYVLGNFYKESRKTTMLAFNRETRMWENEIKELDVGLDYMGYGFVAMGDKIYIRDNLNSFVYWPKQNKWERDEMLNSKRWRNASVVDDLLCYYDHYEKVLRSYDTKQRLWQVVNGVAEMFPEAVYLKAHTVSYGRKLAVFVRGRVSSVKTDPKQIWCAEVSLERRGGEIWGHVEWSDLVIEGHMILVKSLLVMV